MPPRNAPSSRLAFLVGSLLLFVALGAGCGPSESPQECAEDEELTKYRGEVACRTRCVTSSACASTERCVDGVCVADGDDDQSDAGADATSDTGVEDTGPPPADTGPCPPQSGLTIYRGVEKCRSTCLTDEDCSGDLECEDGYCIDRSLPKSDTGITYDTDNEDDTRDTGQDDTFQVTPGTLSCYEILQCRNVCSTMSCQSNALDAGTRQASRDYIDYENCVQQNCPQGSSTCIDRNCRNAQKTGPADRCVPQNVSGSNYTCSELALCLQSCSSRTCEQSCISNASTTGESNLRALSRCLQQHCPSNRPTCIRTNCKREWDRCFNCP